MAVVRIKTETEVDLNVELAAQVFANLDDEQQADFIIQVAEIAKGWGPGKAWYQWFTIGRHLATCDCSTQEARDMILEIARGIEFKGASDAS